MTGQQRLSVQDVTGQIRGVDPTRPVRVGRTTDEVVLAVSPVMAEQLARLIALGVTAARGDLDDTEHLWDETVTELMAAQSVTYLRVVGTAR